MTVGVSQILHKVALVLVESAGVDMTPIAFVEVQRFDFGDLGVRTQPPSDLPQLR